MTPQGVTGGRQTEGPAPPRVRRVAWATSPKEQATRYMERGYPVTVHSEDGRDGRRRFHAAARFAGRCLQPICLRQSQETRLLDGTFADQICDTIARCRKCKACRMKRRTEWAARMVTENLLAERTWFVTLTIAPDWRYALICRAMAHPEWKHMSPAAQKLREWTEFGKEITAYLKRLRINAERRAEANGEARPVLRYSLVGELHKPDKKGDQYWHAHILIHERAGRVSKREIQGAYTIGITEASLLRDPVKGGRYAAKYLSKSMDVRVRASLHYGKEGLGGGQSALSEVKRNAFTKGNDLSPRPPAGPRAPEAEWRTDLGSEMARECEGRIEPGSRGHPYGPLCGPPAESAVTGHRGDDGRRDTPAPSHPGHRRGRGPPLVGVAG